jgi:hypothetical protein
MTPVEANPVRGYDGRLQCVIVTPETTVLDTAATFVALPLFDGGNRSRGTVPIFAAQAGFAWQRPFSPRKWDCPLQPSAAAGRGQVHVFGLHAAWQENTIWPKNGPVPGWPVNGYRR